MEKFRDETLKERFDRLNKIAIDFFSRIREEEMTYSDFIKLLEMLQGMVETKIIL